VEVLRAQRNWLLAIVLLGVVILAAVIGSHPTKTASTGQGQRLKVSFGYHVALAPLSSRINSNNGWIVSVNGSELAVYAGSQTSDSSDGLFVIDRSSASRRLRSIVLRGSSPVTIVEPLPAVTSLQAAARATIHFVTDDGATGTLDLSTGHVSLRAAH
jgi:hypothetical protein